MKILIAVFLMSLFASHCYADNLEIQYSFTAPTDLVQTALRLRMDGTIVCDTADIADDRFECNVAADAGWHAFTLTAVYDDASESPESPAYMFKVGGTGRRFFKVGGSIRRVVLLPEP